MIPELNIVSPAWLERTIGDVTVVDVRPARDFSNLTTVPGAVNVPVDRFRDPSSVGSGRLPDPEEFTTTLGDIGIKPTDHVVAYDDEQGVYAARLLLTAAVYGHHGPLSLLDGGIDAWRRTIDGSASIEGDENAPNEPEQTPTPDSSSNYPRRLTEDAPIVDRGTVEAAVDGDATIVDTRTSAEYAQSHIPSAVQLGWETLLQEDADGIYRLKPESELEPLLDEKGIDRDDRIILYCNTARRLSHTFVVLSHLGFDDVRFYEGSLTDWVRAEAPEWDPVTLQRQVRSYTGDTAFETMIDDLGEEVINRLKLVGLYHQKHEGYFMLRTRAPGGILTAEQATVIGEIADEYARAPQEHGGTTQNPVFGDGYLDVTTRQDIQMHWIEIADMDDIWQRYEDVGLSTLQACGNSVRNVVSCPAAGIDPNETIDVRPTVNRVSERFLGDHQFANLPRKFKVSITGCHENCARAQIQDLAFTPAVTDGEDGFAVRIGGGLSDGPRVASDLDCFVTPDQVDELVAAVAELFMDHGSYMDTAVNRLRYLVEAWGIDRVRAELERRVPFDWRTVDESLTIDYRGDHVGIHEQEDGRYAVGLSVPVGRMAASSFRDLARLAVEYGDGELRLTPNQNVLVPHVETMDIDAFLDEPVITRYSPNPGPFSRGIVTCTGSEFCTYGIIETKNRAIRWARALDEWAVATGLADELDVFRIHMSGCSASCAQPQIGDIGLRGEVYRDDWDTGPAADIGLGGDLAADEFIDWLAGSVPIESIPGAIRETITTYQERRTADETFADWVRRTPDDQLRSILLDTVDTERHPTERPVETDGGQETDIGDPTRSVTQDSENRGETDGE